MDCIICAYPIDDKERLLCLSACNHQEPICSICFLRVRSLQRKFHCPTCKRELDNVICSREREKKFEDFQIWGENIGGDYTHDSRSQMFFPKDYYQQYVSKLWLYQCKVCNVTRRDFKSLRGHYIGEHNLHMCLLCGEHKQVFPSEQKTYTQQEYEKHLRHGDNDGSNGHPNCEFCRIRYYDSTTLFMHLTREHYSCHLCDSIGIRYKYYQSYNELEVHFRKDHFICEELSCLDRKFVAFLNEIDLISHRLQYHPHLSSNRCIPIQFKYKNNSSTNQQSQNNSNTNNNSSGNDIDNIARSARYEGGLGGRANNGEWQVEIEQTTHDPRDPNRNITREDTSVLQSLAASTAPVEEFPELISTNAPSTGLITNKWVSLKEDKKKSKNNFPALPSKPAKPVSAAVANMIKPSANSSRSAVAPKVVSNSTPALDYEEDFMAISASGSRPITMVDSLGTWANVKVDKRANKKKTSSSTNSSAAITDSKPAASSEPAAADSMDFPPPPSSKPKSKAAALKEFSADDDFSSDMQKALNASLDDFNSKATIPESNSSKVKGNSVVVSTSTKSTVSTSSNSTKAKPVPKKPVVNDWSDALKAVGMDTSSKKKKTGGITVVKANSAAMDKLTMSKSSDNLAGLRSSSISPPPPPSSSISSSSNSGKATPPPPPAPTATSISSNSSSAKSEDFSIRNHAGWVNLGGTGGNKNTQGQKADRDLPDFPTLGGGYSKR